MTESKTALGSYLLTKRLTRGGDNLPQYMERYCVASVISESYYRDLEAGRKLIRIQSAEDLCEMLDLDRRAVYYFILKDLVPADVFEQLIPDSATETFRSPAERAEQLEQSNKTLSVALANSWSDNITDLEEAIMTALEADEAALGVLHFIYNRKACTFEEIDDVYLRCGGASKISMRLAEVFGQNILDVDLKRCVVRRRSAQIRVPNNAKGRRFKDAFVIQELQKSLKKERTRRISETDGTLQYSAIVALNKDGQERLSIEGLSRFVSIVQASDKSLEDPDTRPFFVALVLSSRDEYNVGVRPK